MRVVSKVWDWVKGAASALAATVCRPCSICREIHWKAPWSAQTRCGYCEFALQSLRDENGG